jgi:predicted DNA-binding antitoxin AbrB/MazE fold protein
MIWQAEVPMSNKTIHAIFENGVFRPLEQVELPERSKVEFEPRIVEPQQQSLPKSGEMDSVYKVLGERFESGESDVAERHDEHQP